LVSTFYKVNLYIVLSTCNEVTFPANIYFLLRYFVLLECMYLLTLFSFILITGAPVLVADAKNSTHFATSTCCIRASVPTDSLLQCFVNKRGCCYGQLQGRL